MLRAWPSPVWGEVPAANSTVPRGNVRGGFTPLAPSGSPPAAGGTDESRGGCPGAVRRDRVRRTSRRAVRRAGRLHDRVHRRPGPGRERAGGPHPDPERRRCGGAPQRRLRLPGQPQGLGRPDQRHSRQRLSVLRIGGQSRRLHVPRTRRLSGVAGGAHAPARHRLAGRPGRPVLVPLSGHLLRADGAGHLRQRRRALRPLRRERAGGGQLHLADQQLAQGHAVDAGRREGR